VLPLQASDGEYQTAEQSQETWQEVPMSLKRWCGLCKEWHRIKEAT